MQKICFLAVLLTMLALPTYAQHSKSKPSQSAPTNFQPELSWPGKAVVPTATNPFNVATQRPNALPTLQPATVSTPSTVSMVRAENGLPIFFEGKTAASGSATESKPLGERAIEYCASLKPAGLTQPKAEFVVKSIQNDEQGNTHVRMEQVFQGLPVWGGEVVCHAQNGAFSRMNGRYFPTPALSSLTPSLGADAAIDRVKNEIGLANIKTNWTAEDLRLIDGQPFTATLLVFHPEEKLGAERLTWHVAARPNVFSRSEWFVDAQTGVVLNQFEHTCNLLGHFHSACMEGKTESPVAPKAPAGAWAMDGPVNVSGVDLLDVNRTLALGGWQFGNQFTLEDASKPMFKPTASTMPGDPVGVILTLDAFNTSPEAQTFNADLVVSNSTTFSNKKAAISAHFNSIKSFDYFRSKFNRNSIDGVGGNVISLVNVSEPDGTSMENAFWNGQAMFYGNGGGVFKPLARGLDVGGHEMTHGVIEKTANLVYQNESGALNESFADVFGQMIDGDVNDWKIGEDVMQSGGGLPTALRDLSNPHNGQPSNSGFWQPEHTSEQYTGNQNNGGVHINSGIPNRAFFLFASNAAVGTARAEQVYYKALRDYLVKSSKFVDCRLAVIQAATDLYGTAVAAVAANAFATVGIGGSVPSGNYLGQLSANPGTDFALCTSDDGVKLDLATGAGQVLGSLYTQGVKNRPSVTDNGASLVFVNDAGHIIGVDINYFTNPITFTTTQLSTNPEWRNVAISKDGRFVAGITEFEESRIYVFDLASPTGESETFFLYNPTYTQGQITGDVQYADVLEFDYSGQYLMYDAYNDLDGIGYWDVGFIQFWENGQFTDGGDAFITKLFGGLPEKVSVANPTIAKNSPFIIAFDLIDNQFSTQYDIYGANSETGDYDRIVADNGALGWPNYNRLDNKLLYENETFTYDLRLQNLNANKIQAQGGNSLFVPAHYWGVWFGNGSRNLLLDSKEIDNQVFSASISPNPTADVAQIRLQSKTQTGAIVTLHSMLGETLMSRNFSLSVGENVLDLDLQFYPAGHYVLRVVTEQGAGTALKVVRQ